MGYISLVILMLTVVGLVFGALFGLMRGFNRSLLRLGLVVLSVILAVALRGAFVNLVLNADTGEGTVRDMIVSGFTSGDIQMPETMINLIFALIEIIAGLSVYFVLFYAFRFITWAILFPILKIFVKKGEKKRAGLGALIGLAQGAIIAFAMWSPVSGLLLQTDKLLAMEVDGKSIASEVPEEAGLLDYSSSATGVVYNTAGGWYFEMLTTTKDASGRTVKLSDTCDIVVTVMDLATGVQDLGETMSKIDFENATTQDMIDSVKDVADKLVDIDKSIDGLSTNAKTIVNDLISGLGDMIGEEAEVKIPEGFNLERIDLGAVGYALDGIANYFEATLDDANGDPITQSEVDAIVNGFAENMIIFEMVYGEGEYEAVMPINEAEYIGMFKSAIDNIDNSIVTHSEKDDLRKLFGLI